MLLRPGKRGKHRRNAGRWSDAQAVGMSIRSIGKLQVPSAAQGTRIRNLPDRQAVLACRRRLT